jgi:hypothetical protein
VDFDPRRGWDIDREDTNAAASIPEPITAFAQLVPTNDSFLQPNPPHLTMVSATEPSDGFCQERAEKLYLGRPAPYRLDFWPVISSVSRCNVYSSSRVFCGS